MSIYQNSFFKFEIKFSEGWRVRSWANWKKPPEKTSNHQLSDDDLPSLENPSKQLFHAYERKIDSPFILSKQVEMYAIWKENDMDISNEIDSKDNETVRLMTTEKVMNQNWQSIIRTFDVKRYNLHQQIYVCKVLPNIWLYASAAGDTKDNFKSANKQFIAITKLQ